jgi:hypothetical protein
MKRKPNPILAAIELSLKGRRPLVIADGWHKEPRETQLEIIRRLFTQETIDEVGFLVLGAVLAGDKQMIEIVGDAIKAGDHLFSRDREKLLLRRALWYRLTWWSSLMLTHKGDVHASVNALKKGIERECNNKRELEPYQWARLRRVLGVPKRSTVRHDRNPVKHGFVGEIIDLAPPLTKRQEKERKAAEERQLERERQFSRQARARRTSSTKRRKTVS